MEAIPSAGWVQVGRRGTREAPFAVQVLHVCGQRSLNGAGELNGGIKRRHPSNRTRTSCTLLVDACRPVEYPYSLHTTEVRPKLQIAELANLVYS